MTMRIETPAATTAAIEACRSSSEMLRGLKKMPREAKWK